MARQIILCISIFGCVIADGVGHHDHSHEQAAPSSYEAALVPASSYGAPASEYGAPSAEYGAPAAEYGAPQEYDAPTGYSDAYAAEAESGFDLSIITEYLPFFLAVFSAIIVAQLFAPLLGMLFGAKLDLA